MVRVKDGSSGLTLNFSRGHCVKNLIFKIWCHDQWLCSNLIYFFYKIICNLCGFDPSFASFKKSKTHQQNDLITCIYLNMLCLNNKWPFMCSSLNTNLKCIIFVLFAYVFSHFSPRDGLLNSWRAVVFHIWSLSQRPKRLSQNMDCHCESDVWRLGTSWHVVQHLCWTCEGGEGISGTCASPGDGDITKPQGQGSTKTHLARSKHDLAAIEWAVLESYISLFHLHQSPKISLIWDIAL